MQKNKKNVLIKLLQIKCATTIQHVQVQSKCLLESPFSWQSNSKRALGVQTFKDPFVSSSIGDQSLATMLLLFDRLAALLLFLHACAFVSCLSVAASIPCFCTALQNLPASLPAYASSEHPPLTWSTNAQANETGWSVRHSITCREDTAMNPSLLNSLT
jgi:hypothetical protein